MSTPSILDSVHLGSSPLGIHYTQVLRATLAIIWRRKLLVLSTMALAIALGGIVVIGTPKQYTAQSFVHGGFTARDLISGIQGRNGASIGFDALQLRSFLSRKKILIRACDTFTGLGPEYFRVAVKRRTDNMRLLAALEEWTHLVNG